LVKYATEVSSIRLPLHARHQSIR